MSITSRTRSTTRQVAKAQRRIALVQVLFWPAVVIGGVTVGAVALLTLRRRASMRRTEEPSSSSSTAVAATPPTS